MVSTRTEKKATLVRVFHDVLDLEDDSDLLKACIHDGIVSMEDLLALNSGEIEDLTFLVGTSRTLISKGQRGLVFALQALSHKRDMEGDRIHSDWSNVNLEEFDAYRSSNKYRSSRTGLINPAAPRTATSSCRMLQVGLVEN